MEPSSTSMVGRTRVFEPNGYYVLWQSWLALNLHLQVGPNIMAAIALRSITGEPLDVGDKLKSQPA
jgi:hypothetical protein